METPGGYGLAFSFNVIAWLTTVVLISLGIWQITLKQKFHFNQLSIICFMGTCFLFIPMFYSYQFTDHAIPRLLAVVAGLLLLLCFYQFQLSKLKAVNLLWLILIGVAVEVSIGLVQFFILGKGDWGGFDPNKNRIHGIFLQPNVMASFMATGIALSLYLSSLLKENLLKESPATESLLKNSKDEAKENPPGYLLKIKQITVYYNLFGASFLLILIQSRTAYLAMLISLFFLLTYLAKKNKHQLFKNALVIIIAISAALYSQQESTTVVRSNKIYSDAGARATIYEVSSKMILDNPITGYGYGNFERAYLDYYNQLKLNEPERNPAILKLDHPHNEILFWGIEGGIAALIGLVCFAIAYINTLLKLPITKAFALLGLITPILLHSQTEYPFYHSASHWIIFLMLIWYTDQQSNSKKYSIIIKPTFLLRFFAIFLPVIFVPFLLTSLHTGYLVVQHEKSGYINIDKLVPIINPLPWRSRLENSAYAHILFTALEHKNPIKLQRYVTWGLNRIKFKPRIIIYSNLLLCLKIQGKETEYKKLLAEAKQTYPLETNWGKSLSLEH
ncbi:MAG: O-antigen ligase C-terminal domain-containing protein [Alteromonadaceae bacterium]|nr:O-antigen ligase C-terminal domain-containing protein [Alteromonadaceae bacterium]